MEGADANQQQENVNLLESVVMQEPEAQEAEIDLMQLGDLGDGGEPVVEEAADLQDLRVRPDLGGKDDSDAESSKSSGSSGGNSSKSSNRSGKSAEKKATPSK